MTTYTRTADGKAFTATEDGHTFTRTLDDIMGLDALTVRVNADGTVTDDIREHRAPEELYGDDDAIRATVDEAGWTLLEGYTGQYGYNGPVLHASEFIGGGLEAAILETPGLYAVEVVYADVDEDDEDSESEPAGWVVMRKSEEPFIPALGNSTCMYVFDGRDEDGTPFYQCLTHGELEISHDAPCAVWADGEDPMLYDAPAPLDLPTRSISPRDLAARSLAGQATARRVIIPETPHTARRAYVAARERGETVSLALTRARLEMVTTERYDLFDALPDAHGDCAACEAGETSEHNPEIPTERYDLFDAMPEESTLTTVCLSCGHRYGDDTPSGRCPREAFHVFDDVEDDESELSTPVFTIVMHIDLSLDDTPWTATLMNDGKVIAEGVGSTPAEAVECLVEDAENYDDEAAREFLGL